MSITVAKWTINEYHSMINAGLLDHRQVELLKGEIVEISPEGEAHAYFSSETEEYLKILLSDRKLIIRKILGRCLWRRRSLIALLNRSHFCRVGKLNTSIFC
jgi:Uma2 family endonuclease